MINDILVIQNGIEQLTDNGVSSDACLDPIHSHNAGCSSQGAEELAGASDLVSDQDLTLAHIVSQVHTSSTTCTLQLLNIKQITYSKYNRSQC